MIDKQKAGGRSPGDTCGPAPLRAEVGTAGTTGTAPDSYILSHAGPACQPPARNLIELAAVALGRASAAGMIAECCGLAGDPLGRDYWLRRRARHLSIVWAATHPPQEVPT